MAPRSTKSAAKVADLNHRQHRDRLGRADFVMDWARPNTNNLEWSEDPNGVG